MEREHNKELQDQIKALLQQRRQQQLSLQTQPDVAVENLNDVDALKSLYEDNCNEYSLLAGENLQKSNEIARLNDLVSKLEASNSELNDKLSNYERESADIPVQTSPFCFNSRRISFSI